MPNRNNKYDPQNIRGISIYHEDKKTVYSPSFQQKGYIVSESNVHAYITYIQGYLVAPVAFIAAYIIWRNLWVSFLAALVVVLVTIVNFYFNFIRKASVIDPFERPVRDSFIARQATLEKRRLWEIIICCPILAGLIMLYSYLSGFEDATYYIMLATAIAAVLYGLVHLYVLIYKNKKNF